MAAILILNPAADKGRAGQMQAQLESWARPYGGTKIERTQQPGHARQLARQAEEEGCDLIIAAGGDGTIHEVVNGLVQGNHARTRLAVVPIGSGNDFVGSLGLPVDPQAALQRAFEGQVRRIDLARLEDDQGRFVIVSNAVGVGFDALIAIEASMITRVHGFPMYLLATLRTILFQYYAPNFRFRFDQEKVAQPGLLLAIGLGARVGGGFRLTPEARHDDGLLDSCLIGPVGRLTMLRMLTQVMQGTHVTHSAVRMFRNQQISLTADQALPVHVDGEIFAYPRNNVRRLTITSLPQALQLMV